ncbi:MAG: hypothetical protein IT201_01185 [Thermoleophilia bacterium]|nr:hypothetical protein [Thermoleophilia bacterium]
MKLLVEAIEREVGAQQDPLLVRKDALDRGQWNDRLPFTEQPAADDDRGRPSTAAVT